MADESAVMDRLQLDSKTLQATIKSLGKKSRPLGSSRLIPVMDLRVYQR